MYPELTPKTDTLEAGKRLIYRTASIARYRNKVRKSESNGRQQMWPLWLEDVFLDALLLIPPMGQTRIRTDGQPPIIDGRNTLVAKYLSMHGWTPTLPRCTTPLWCIKEKRDFERARKQVSSHCQILKAFYSTLVTSHFLFHVKRSVLQEEKSFLNLDRDMKSLKSYEILTAVANGRLPVKQPNYGYFYKLLNANDDVFLRPKEFWMFVSSSNRERRVTLGDGTIKPHAARFTSNDQGAKETADACPNFKDGSNSKKVLNAGSSPLHVLHEYSRGLLQTESSSVGALSRKWAEHFPRLREKLVAAHNDTQPSDTETSRCVVGPCDTLHFVVTLDLETGPQCLDASELTCVVELSIDRATLYNHSWRTVTSVMKPDELRLSRSEPEVWDLDELAEASISHDAGCTSGRPCRCAQHHIRIPFPVDTWAAILTKLAPYPTADRDHEENRPGSHYRRRQAQSRKIQKDGGFGKSGGSSGTRNVTELLSEVAVYQEIWSAPNAGGWVPEVSSGRSWTRRAVVLWTFNPVQKRKDKSPEPSGATWRFLTKLDSFSQYHQEHAYVEGPYTAWPNNTGMLLDQDASSGYTSIDDDLSGLSVAAPAPHEWPLVSSCGLTDQLSAASQYNSYISSFGHVNATTNSGTDNILNSCLYSIFDDTNYADTQMQMQIPGPSNILGTAFADPCFFDSVPTEVNNSRHLLDTIPSNGNTSQEEMQEINTGSNTVFVNSFLDDPPMLWNDACPIYLQGEAAQQYETPKPDSLWDTGYVDTNITPSPDQSNLTNFVVYVTGQRPNPPPSPDTVGFITQFHNNGNTTYFIPPDLPTGRQAQILDTRRQDLELHVAPTGTSFTTPGAVISGRVYVAQNRLQFSLGPGHLIIPPDPNYPGSPAYTNPNSFVEFTYTGDNITVNLSFVDMIGLALGLNLTFYDGDEQTTRSMPGLKPDGLGRVCDGLALLGGFWPSLCVRDEHQNPLHVISPRTFAKPATADIWGCASGPFANPRGAVWTRERAVPVLCAAFVRSIIHLDGTQPSDFPTYQFYKNNVTNHYARLVHENLIEDMGYAFSYDDVTPDANINSAGLISGKRPTHLNIFINI
ncbi:hypothetical protein F5Y03DRAFT_404756 [Xylaria venustula]|nr:hypothetical protein F5Y03DRAFT_404756 [Xylaria venustula]